MIPPEIHYEPTDANLAQRLLVFWSGNVNSGNQLVIIDNWRLTFIRNNYLVEIDHKAGADGRRGFSSQHSGSNPRFQLPSVEFITSSNKSPHVRSESRRDLVSPLGRLRLIDALVDFGGGIGETESNLSSEADVALGENRVSEATGSGK